jgi:3-oxoadipate enol-lactonase
MTETESVFRCADGATLGFTVRGQREAGRRIALVHSLAMDRTFWRQVVERLEKVASVLVYDCRGHGHSEKSKGPYTISKFADDLAELMNHVGWKSAVVAGASMGGCVSLAFGQTYPERTEGLGLIDTTAWYGNDAEVQWEERAGKAMQRGLHDLVDFQVTRWFSDEFRAR